MKNIIQMKTLVLGASTNKERYSYKAIHNLVDKSHQVVAIGSKREWHLIFQLKQIK